MRHGKIVDYEIVVGEINKIAISYSASLGVDEIYEVVEIKLRAEKSKYKDLVQLLGELFVHSVFDSERYGLIFVLANWANGRLSIEVSKAQNDIPAAKR